jgi:hypothetical protein
MKKTFISILLLTIFISCSKKELGNLEFIETIKGGCFLEKGSSASNGSFIKPDTVTYSVNNDSLNLFVGFNDTCCSEYITSSSVTGDSILIKIQTSQIGLCNCLCYYTFNFIFSGSADSYKYHISGSNLNFIGTIKH